MLLLAAAADRAGQYIATPEGIAGRLLVYLQAYMRCVCDGDEISFSSNTKSQPSIGQRCIHRMRDQRLGLRGGATVVAIAALDHGLDAGGLLSIPPCTTFASGRLPPLTALASLGELRDANV
ncbi:unnamed protein product [Parajaminaea phylloscopi]